MRNIFAIIFVILTLISLCTFEQLYVNKSLNSIENKTFELLEISKNIETINNNTIKNKVEELTSTWNNQENILFLLVNHKDLTELCIEIQKLSISVKLNDKYNFLTSLKIIDHLTKDYKKSFKISFQNIF